MLWLQVVMSWERAWVHELWGVYVGMCVSVCADPGAVQ